jgi:ribonuclease-3
MRLPVPPRRRIDVSREHIERLTGLQVRDLSLYKRALTHRSILRAHPESHLVSNERLEFLGDSVLGFVVAEHLHHRFPHRDEGFLTKLRSKLVNGQALARQARNVELGPLIIMSENMEQTGGQRSVSILADAFEAVIGAIYLDLGLEETRRFIHRTMLEEVDLEALAQQHDNYKSMLLEYAQAQGWPQPRYRVTMEEGPSHDRTFTVEVIINDRPCGSGTAGSKKRAEQMAASEALQRLEVE